MKPMGYNRRQHNHEKEKISSIHLDFHFSIDWSVNGIILRTFT